MSTPIDERSTAHNASASTEPTRDRPSTRATAMSPLALFGTLLRYRRVVLGLPAGLAIAAVAFTLLRGPRWDATSTFMPQSSSSTEQRLSSLAAQFGLTSAIPTSDVSLDFYEGLLTSRDILDRVALTTYAFATDSTAQDTVRGNLLQIFDVKQNTHTKMLAAAVEELQNHMTINKDDAAGTVTFSVSTPYGPLSERIARRFLDLITEFDQHRRQSQAAAERRFVGGRMVEAKHEVDSVEALMRQFLDENRTYQSSPRLSFEADRLQSELNLRRSVYTGLAQSYEQARIDEVRNTPVITIIDAPEGSALPSGGLVLNALLGIFLGGVLATAIVFGREYLAGLSVDRPDEYAAFVGVWREAVSGVRRTPRGAWAWAKRRLSRRR